MARVVIVALCVSLLAAGCADDDAEPDRITRIDGPASVEEDE